MTGLPTRTPPVAEVCAAGLDPLLALTPLAPEFTRAAAVALG